MPHPNGYPEWYCELCETWITEGHLLSRKHVSRIGYCGKGQPGLSAAAGSSGTGCYATGVAQGQAATDGFRAGDQSTWPEGMSSVQSTWPVPARPRLGLAANSWPPPPPPPTLAGQIENLTRIVMQLSSKVTELSERIETLVAGLLTQGQGRDGDTESGHRNNRSQSEWQYLSDGNMQGVTGNMDSIHTV